MKGHVASQVSGLLLVGGENGVMLLVRHEVIGLFLVGEVKGVMWLVSQ